TLEELQRLDSFTFGESQLSKSDDVPGLSECGRQLIDVDRSGGNGDTPVACDRICPIFVVVSKKPQSVEKLFSRIEGMIRVFKVKRASIRIGWVRESPEREELVVHPRGFNHCILGDVAVLARC